METTEKLLPEAGQQNGAVWTIVDTGTGEVCIEIIPHSNEAPVGDSVSDLIQVNVDMADQSAAEPVVLDPRGKRRDSQGQSEKWRSAKKGSKTRKHPTQTVPSIQDAVMNGTELTAPMRLAIQMEKKKRLKDLIDDKMNYILGLPKQSKLPTDTVTVPSIQGGIVNKTEPKTAKQVKSKKSKIINGECLSKHQPNEHPEETGTKDGLQDCEENVHQCGQCGHISTDAISLKNHTMIHSVKDFICDICGDSFSSKENLKNHTVHHSENRPFKCQHCDWEFKRKRDLNRHLLTHSSERPHVCSVCGKGFKRRTTYLTHVQNFHGKDESRHLCSICGITFTGRQVFSNHQQTHSAEEMHICPHCGYQCKWLSNMRLHIKRHFPDKKKYICEDCGSVFFVKSAFKKHQDTKCDSDDTPFKCKKCEKMFTTAYKLKVHQTVHQSERPYVCNLCEATFKSRTRLTVHRRRVHRTVNTKTKDLTAVEILPEEPAAQSTLTC